MAHLLDSLRSAGKTCGRTMADALRYHVGVARRLKTDLELCGILAVRGMCGDREAA